MKFSVKVDKFSEIFPARKDLDFHMLNVILSYLPYALITTFTPGPNNLMSLYAVSSYGWRKGSRVILGIFSGFSKSGFFLALSNVKVILYLITIFTAYVIPSGGSLTEMFIHGGLIIALSAVSWGLWGTAGGLLQRFLSEHYRAFNIAMGIALIWCAVKILM